MLPNNLNLKHQIYLLLLLIYNFLSGLIVSFLGNKPFFCFYLLSFSQFIIVSIMWIQIEILKNPTLKSAKKQTFRKRKPHPYVAQMFPRTTFRCIGIWRAPRTLQNRRNRRERSATSPTRTCDLATGKWQIWTNSRW